MITADDIKLLVSSGEGYNDEVKITVGHASSYVKTTLKEIKKSELPTNFTLSSVNETNFLTLLRN